MELPQLTRLTNSMGQSQGFLSNKIDVLFGVSLSESASIQYPRLDKETDPLSLLKTLKTNNPGGSS